MKLTKLLLLKAAGAIILGIGLVGCSEESESEFETGVENIGESMENTWNNISDYTAEQSEAFSNTLNASLEDMDDRIDRWQAEGDQLSEETMQAYRSAKENFQESMKAVGEASEDTWQKTKGEVSEAWNDLQEAFDDVKSEVESA